MTIIIRPYRPTDQAAIRALHDRTPPAGQTATITQPWPPDLDRIIPTYRAFWVAVDGEASSAAVVGMVGLQPPGDDVPVVVLCGSQAIVMKPANQRRYALRGAKEIAVHLLRSFHRGFSLGR